MLESILRLVRGAFHYLFDWRCICGSWTTAIDMGDGFDSHTIHACAKCGRVYP